MVYQKQQPIGIRDFYKKHPEIGRFLDTAFSVEEWAIQGRLIREGYQEWYLNDVKQVLKAEFDEKKQELNFEFQIYGNKVVQGTIRETTTCDCDISYTVSAALIS
jgi:hypothetical protein